MFYDDDADLHLLDGKTVAIIGYGSHGHAHALNLNDSGVAVVVGLRPDSSSVAKAEQHGLRVTEPADAASEGDIVMMLVPDELHKQVWESGVGEGIAPGNLLLFGHGFSVHYEQVVAPSKTDVALVAPKGPGHLVRRQLPGGLRRAGTGSRRPGCDRNAHARQAGDRRRVAPGDEGPARPDPVRRLRPGMDRREPRRPGELQAHALRQGGHQGELVGRELRAQMDWIDTEFQE